MFAEDWFDEWLTTYKESSVSNSWYSDLQAIVNARILPQIGRYKLHNVKPIHLQKLLSDCSGYSKSYIRKIYNILNECFGAAKKNGLILENPAENLKIPTGKKEHRRRSITAKERKYILSTCEKHRGGTFLKIMLYCGLRPGEVAALTWKDINLKNNTLSVDKSLKRDGHIGDPKSYSGFRTVPIPEHFAKELKSLQGNPFEYVCTNAGGNRHTINSIRQMWNSFIYHLNIEMGCRTFKGGLLPPLPVADDLVMYCLRHTYCTDLQAAGVPINVARELMGHSNIALTAQIYTHSSEESFASAAASINMLHESRSII